MFQGSPHQLLLWTQMLVTTSMLVVVCAVFVAGWLRHRLFGYVILAAWAGVSATWYLLAQLVLPLVVAKTLGSTADATAIHLLVNTVSRVILLGMLLTGACLIVFKDKRPLPETY